MFVMVVILSSLLGFLTAVTAGLVWDVSLLWTFAFYLAMSWTYTGTFMAAALGRRYIKVSS